MFNNFVSANIFTFILTTKYIGAKKDKIKLCYFSKRNLYRKTYKRQFKTNLDIIQKRLDLFSTRRREISKRSMLFHNEKKQVKNNTKL
jgi:hypothetical protein